MSPKSSKNSNIKPYPHMQTHNNWLYLVMGERGIDMSHIISESFSSVGFQIRYSQEANMMEHKCSCCQEVQTSIRKVTLRCSDGTHLDHSYTYVDQCSCVGAECIPQDTVNQQQQTGNIWGKDLSRKRECLKLELKRSQTRVEHRLKQTFGGKKKKSNKSS